MTQNDDASEDRPADDEQAKPAEPEGPPNEETDELEEDEAAASKGPSDILEILPETARGEIDDDDLAALQEAIESIDFAERKTSDERRERLEALRDRLSAICDQVTRGVRRIATEMPPSEKQLERYETLVDDGISAAEREDYVAARARLEEAVLLHPNGVPALFNLGVLYGLRAQREISRNAFYEDEVANISWAQRALFCYERLLSIEPAHTGALNNMAGLFQLTDQKDTAIETLERSLEIDTDQPRVREWLTELRERSGRLRPPKMELGE